MKRCFQHSVRTGSPGPNILTTFSMLTPSAMISSPTLRVEEIDGCSTAIGAVTSPSAGCYLLTALFDERIPEETPRRRLGALRPTARADRTNALLTHDPLAHEPRHACPSPTMPNEPAGHHSDLLFL